MYNTGKKKYSTSVRGRYTDSPCPTGQIRGSDRSGLGQPPQRNTSPISRWLRSDRSGLGQKLIEKAKSGQSLTEV